MENIVGNSDLGSVFVDVPQNKGCTELDIIDRDKARYQEEIENELAALNDSIDAEEYIDDNEGVQRDKEHYRKEIDKESDTTSNDSTDDEESVYDSDEQSDYENEKKCEERSDLHKSCETSVEASDFHRRSPLNYGQSVENGSYEERSDVNHDEPIVNHSESEESVSNEDYGHYAGNRDLTSNGHCDNENDESDDNAESLSTHSHRCRNVNSTSAGSYQDKVHYSASSETISYSIDKHGQGDNSCIRTSNQPGPSHCPQPYEELQAEYMQLQIIYKSTCDELENVKNAEVRYKLETEHKMKNLELKQALLEDETKMLSSKLQESQNLISDYKHERNVLAGEIKALEKQLSAMNDAKDEALSKLDGYEITISSLEKQIRDLSGTESLARLRNQQDKMFEDLKHRQQREVLKYKEIIEDLESKLNRKILDAENWKTKNAELEQRLQDLKMEKFDQFNKMSHELENVQKRCNKYLESGTIEEMGALKQRVQHLEEEKLNAETENIALKADIKSLKAELNASEALQKLTISSRSDYHTPDRQTDINLQKELENSLKNVRNLRSEKLSLKKQLKEAEKSLSLVNKNSEKFEFRCVESEKKVQELEEKLSKLLTDKSDSRLSFEQKCKSLEEELVKNKLKLNENTEKFQKVLENERILSETNIKLQSTISEMLQSHAQEKIKAVEECRKKYLEIHENTLRKEKEKILHQTEEISRKYKNEIAEMEEKIKSLKKEIYDSKVQYLSLYEENKVLQSQLDSMTKPKEREEIEKEVHQVYESKFKKMKETLVSQNKEFLEKHFKEELENAQLKWTQEKMGVVKEYLETSKKQLDEVFQTCLQKERDIIQKKLESEKEMLHKDYKELANNLRAQLDEERKLLKSEKDQNIEFKQTKELEELIQRHEREMKSMKEMYEKKISMMENEIKHLHEMSGLLSSRTKDIENFKKLHQDLVLEHEKCQKEMAVYKSKESNWHQTQNKLIDKIKKYERHVSLKEKHFKEKQAKLQSQLSNLEEKLGEKQNEILLVKEKFEQDKLNFGEKFKSRIKNSSCQTFEEMVPKQSLQDLQEQFFTCLKNISNGVQEFAIESKKRHAKQLKASLQHYHQQISEKSIQDLSKVARSFTPTFVMPHTSLRNPSESTRVTFPSTPSFQTLRNVNFKTSTPDLLNSNSRFENPKGKSGLLKNNKYSTINSMSDTQVKSLYGANTVSNIVPTRYQSVLKNDSKNYEGRDINAFVSEELSKKTPTSFGPTIPNSEGSLKFEDISYDFLNITGGLFNVNNLPGFSFPQSFNATENKDYLKHSYPVKLSHD